MAICVTFYQGQEPIRLVPSDVTAEEALKAVAEAISAGRVFIPSGYQVILNPAASVRIEIEIYNPADSAISYEMTRDDFLGSHFSTPYQS